jgi:hypothetical protein
MPTHPCGSFKHGGRMQTVKLKTLPLLAPWPIVQHLWVPFNKPELAVPYSKDYSSLNNHAVNDNGLQLLKAMIPSNAQHASVDPGVNILYHFHCHNDNLANLVGLGVVGVDGICPAFLPITNTNIFGHYFGISSTTMGTAMSMQYCHSNLFRASVFWTTPRTKYHTHLTLFDLVQRSQRSLLHAFLSIFSSTAYISIPAISTFSNQFSMLHLPPAFRHSLMVLLGFVYPIASPPPIRTIPRPLPSFNLSRIQAQF